MNKKLLIVVLGVALVTISCTEKRTSGSYIIDNYHEQFDSLLNSLGRTPDRIDSLYTEMYIAFKASINDSVARNIVIEKANQLLELDTIRDNQLHYLEAVSFVYRLNEDDDKFRQTAFRAWNLYPTESVERLSSYAMYYSKSNNLDSLRSYSERATNAAQRLLKSRDSEDRGKGIVASLIIMIINNQQSEGKLYLEERIKSESDPELIQMLKDIYDDYDYIVVEIKKSTNCKFLFN